MFRRLLISLCGLGAFLCLQLGAAGGDGLITSLKPTGSITDQANLLSPGTEDRLRGILDQLEQETQATIAVVTLPSIEGGQVDDFTNRLFEAWGVGQAGVDNGVMLLVAVAERKMRIEVGYGLEGVIPDALAGSIRDQYVLAHFKQNNMEAGIEAGTLALADRIAKHHGVTLSAQPMLPTGQASSDSDDRFMLILFAMMIGYTIDRIIRARGGRHHGRRHYRDGFHGGGSSHGGFGGGGGFSGGGFGGGMSGGGGASGSW